MSYRKFYYTAIPIALQFTLSGCVFWGAPSPNEVNVYFNKVAITEPYSTYQQPATGSLVNIRHGASCAKANSAVHENNLGEKTYGIGVNQGITMPKSMDSGTVFLNGWRTTFTKKDHHLSAFSTAITNIHLVNGQLKWKAGGVISDKNGDDPFAWCYFYTALMWNSKSLLLDLEAKHSDENAEMTIVSAQNATYKIQPVSFENLSESKVLLPRGFGIMYEPRGSGNIIEGRLPNHHLNRFALKYGDTTSNGSSLYWDFETIFRDKSSNDNYYAAELVSILQGKSVSLRDSRFNIYLGQQSGGPGYQEVIARTITVDNLNFDYAIPILSGWDIGVNSNSDSHVGDMGVWIESFSYDRNSGRLTYLIKSKLSDDGNNHSPLDVTTGAGVPRYQVKVLGINTVPTAYVPNQPADSIPSPAPPPIIPPSSGSTSGSQGGTSNPQPQPSQPQPPRGKPSLFQ